MSASERHLDPAELFALHAGDLAEREAREARDHLESCGLCSVESELARSFADTSDVPLDEEVAARLRAHALPSRSLPVVRRTARSAWMAPLQRTLLAASVALAALGIWQLVPRDVGLEPGRALRSTAPVPEWGLRAETSEDGWRVNWSEQPQAEAYAVRVYDALGNVVWETHTESNVAEVDRSSVRAPGSGADALFVGVSSQSQAGEHASPLVALP